MLWGIEVQCHQRWVMKIQRLDTYGLVSVCVCSLDITLYDMHEENTDFYRNEERRIEKIEEKLC